MKTRKLFAALLAAALVATAPAALAQEAVQQATMSAQAVKLYANKKNLKELEKNYAKALKAIADVQAYAKKKVIGYEAVAEQAPDWIRLHKVMTELKADSIVAFEVPDNNYDSILTDARQKMCDYYFTTAVEQFDKAKKYDQQVATFATFDQSLRFGDTYAAKIIDIKNMTQIPQAHAWAQSKKETERIAAIALYGEIAERNDSNELILNGITPEWDQLRETFYAEAEALFAKRNYESQYSAMQKYQIVGDYKDAVEKAALAAKRGKLQIAIVEQGADTAIALSAKTLKILSETFPAYCIFGGMEGLHYDDLAKHGCTIALRYDRHNFGKHTYSSNSENKQRYIVKYIEKITDKNGGQAEKEISVRDYEKGMKKGNHANFEHLEGTLTTTTTTVTIEVDYPLDIFDLRHRRPRRIGDIRDASHFELSEVNRVQETYTGDEGCRPAQVQTIDNNLSESAMLKKAEEKKIYGWDIETFLQKQAKKIAAEINDNVSYEHFEF